MEGGDRRGGGGRVMKQKEGEMRNEGGCRFAPGGYEIAWANDF